MPKNTTILALAAALTALSAAIVEEYGGEAVETTTAGAAEAPKKRGRPAAIAEPAEDFKTFEQLQAIIKPLVDDKRALEVRAILKRLGVEKLAELPNEKQAEFLKDVEALLNDSV